MKMKMKWKPLVKMKMVVDISFGIKVWCTLFYLTRESYARASCIGNFFFKLRREKVTKIREFFFL